MTVRLLESASPIATSIHQCALLTARTILKSGTRGKQIASAREPAVYVSITDYLAAAYRRRRIQ